MVDRDTITSAAACLLAEHADELTFEDIQSLDQSLHEHGSDPDLATAASHEAMTIIQRRISSEILDIETVEDLDDFEDNIIKFMRRRNYLTASISWHIDRRRDDLLEEGRLERRGAFRGTSLFSSGKNISDEQIRSLFGTLGLRR